jgi:hypothetical protein
LEGQHLRRIGERFGAGLDIPLANHLQLGRHLLARIAKSHVFLIGQRNRDRLIEQVLELQRLAVSHREALRQPGVDRIAHLRARLNVLVVIAAIDVG